MRPFLSGVERLYMCCVCGLELNVEWLDSCACVLGGGCWVVCMVCMVVQVLSGLHSVAQCYT